MELSRRIDRADPDPRVVTLLNRTAPEQFLALIEAFFSEMRVEVREERTGTGEPTDAVVLHDREDPLAISTLSALRDSVLLVNSDVYITGTRGIDEIATPDVLTALATVLIPAGPEIVEDKNKFLLIQLSRHIEAMALQADDGQLHTSFQQLSRLRDEPGTEKAYRSLAASGVDPHVYGVPDHDPEHEALTVHGAETDELRKSWFVIHDGAGNEGWMAALVAEETSPGSNTYRGFWTFEADRVRDVLSYVRETYPPTVEPSA